MSSPIKPPGKPPGPPTGAREGSGAAGKPSETFEATLDRTASAEGVGATDTPDAIRQIAGEVQAGRLSAADAVPESRE